MSLLLHRPQSPRGFLMRPNTHVLKLPTGSDFYFSLPFDMNWLRPLRPIELTALRDHLSDILDEATNTMGHVGMYNVLDVRREIAGRLSSADQLTEMENRAWDAGHGFPVFDCFSRLTSFSWDWDAIHFECGPAVVAWYVRWLYDFQNKPCYERYAVRRSVRFEENRIWCDWWVDEGQVVIEWYCNGESVCAKVYGASFRNYDEWQSLRTNLEPYELELLNQGTARLRNAARGGWELVVYLDGAQPLTGSKTSSGLEDGCMPSPPAADVCLNHNHAAAEPTPPDSDSWDECRLHQAQTKNSKKHTCDTEHILTSEQHKSHTPPSPNAAPHLLSELFHQAGNLANKAKQIEAQLSPTEKPQQPPPSHPPPPFFSKSPTYPMPPTPHLYPVHCPQCAVPLAPKVPTKSTRRRDATAPKAAAPPTQPYQAYAEDDDNDDDMDTELSIRAPPNSWRDV